MCLYISAYEDPETLVSAIPIDCGQHVCPFILTNILFTALQAFHSLKDHQIERRGSADFISTLEKDEDVAKKLDVPANYVTLNSDTVKNSGIQRMATKIEYNKRNIENFPLEKISTSTARKNSKFMIYNSNSSDFEVLRSSDSQRLNFKPSMDNQRSKSRSMVSPKALTVICQSNIQKDSKKTHSKLLTLLKKKVTVTRRKNTKQPNKMHRALRNLTENKLNYLMSKNTNRHVEVKTIADGTYRKYRTKQATPAKLINKNSKKYSKQCGSKYFINSIKIKTCYMNTKTSISTNQNKIQNFYKTYNKYEKQSPISRISCTRKCNKKEYETNSIRNKYRKKYYRKKTKCGFGDPVKIYKDKTQIITEVPRIISEEKTIEVPALKQRVSNRTNLILDLLTRNGNDDLEVKKIECFRNDSELSAPCLDSRIDSNILTNFVKSKQIEISNTKISNFSSKSNASAKYSNASVRYSNVINNSKVSTKIETLRIDCFTPKKIMNNRYKSEALIELNSRHGTETSNANVNMRKRLKFTPKVKQSRYDTNQEVANIGNDFKTSAKQQNRRVKSNTLKILKSIDNSDGIKVPQYDAFAKSLVFFGDNSKIPTDVPFFKTYSTMSNGRHIKPTRTLHLRREHTNNGVPDLSRINDHSIKYKTNNKREPSLSTKKIYSRNSNHTQRTKTVGCTSISAVPSEAFKQFVPTHSLENSNSQRWQVWLLRKPTNEPPFFRSIY